MSSFRSDIDQFRQPRYEESSGQDQDASNRRSRSRVFKPYQTYKPTDLNDEIYWQEKQTSEKRKAPEKKEDFFAVRNWNPIKVYKNTVIFPQFLDDNGAILSRKATGLTRLNQQRMAKAVRRARAMGLIPFTGNVRQYLNRSIMFSRDYDDSK
ncbi:ribosomal protein S18 [Polychytrium aggregatum]|uniref:ribosomal protein S18 n=1 Tax=Polychytrium aggregatum TaxID=110093 RepID=UPI0022FE1618|nr:ribosomal protein S18 [Polychytrium aggregatum]KAI9203979.1 ribosomal protein S18 [Polychytrium aggregatum]